MKKYEEVYEQLRRKILDKTFPEKSYLPNEESLAADYHISRETLRKSLQMLANEGYIQKQPKKGNLVLAVDQYTLSATHLSSFKEFSASQGAEIKTKTVVFDFQEVACPKNLQQDMAEYADNRMYYIARRRVLNGESVIIDKDYISRTAIPGLTAKISGQSIYDFIEKELKLSIGYAKREIKVEAVTDEDKKYMDLTEQDTHIVVVRSKAYLTDSRFFQFTESRHRIDKFKILEFAKRRNAW